jgi:hypothetical protein
MDRGGKHVSVVWIRQGELADQVPYPLTSASSTLSSIGLRVRASCADVRSGMLRRSAAIYSS